MHQIHARALAPASAASSAAPPSHPPSTQAVQKDVQSNWHSIPTHKYSTSYLSILPLIIPIFAIMNKYY